MYINPNTQIVLCSNIPWDNDYTSTILFGSQSEQLAYFETKKVATANQVTFVKHTKDYFDLEINIATSKNVNYAYFKNIAYDDKYYFVFINNYEYVNDNCTRFFFEIDYLQTYLFDIQYKACFVEREHVNDDSIGLHSIYENVETGDLFNSYNQSSMIGGTLCPIMVLTDCNPDGTSLVSYGNYNSGIFNGLNFFAINPFYYNNENPPILFYWIKDYIRTLTQSNKLDSIVCIYLYPMNLLNVSFSQSVGYIRLEETNFISYTVNKNTLRSNCFKDYGTITRFYTPKNNKLYNNQFIKTFVENGNGGSVEYDINKFYESLTFRIYGALTPNGDTRLIPFGYQIASELNNEYGLVGGGYPQCAWVSDYYSSWLMANGNQVSSSIGNAVASTLLNPSSLLSGNGLISQINNVVAKQSDAKNISDSAKGKQSNYINCITGFSDFNLIVKSIDYNHAKVIDDYFSMFGYQINEIKIPNVTGRRSWNYVKTINNDFDVNGPADAVSKIHKIFDDGIFLWHSYDVGNFALDNSVTF